MGGIDFEEAIFHVRSTTKWVKEHENFDLQAKEMILPLSVLKGGAGGFLAWLLNATNDLSSPQRTEMIDKLKRSMTSNSISGYCMMPRRGSGRFIAAPFAWFWSTAQRTFIPRRLLPAN
jgi:hypothetical protein